MGSLIGSSGLRDITGLPLLDFSKLKSGLSQNEN